MRRRDRALLLITTAVIAVLVLPLAYVAISDRNPDRTIDARPHLTIAGHPFPIESFDPISPGPPAVYTGVGHLTPSFDTSHLGVDLSFVWPEDPRDLADEFDDRAGRAIFLGQDSAGSPFFVWQTQAANPIELLVQLIADAGAVGRLATSHGGLVAGQRTLTEADPVPTIEPLATGSIQRMGDDPAVLTAEWLFLPPDVSVVVVHVNGHPVFWQTPVSGVASLQSEIDVPPDTSPSLTMDALTSEGEYLYSVDLFHADSNDGVPVP